MPDEVGTDFAAIGTTKMRAVPYRWGLVNGFPSQPLLDRLMDEFPSEGFATSERRSGSDKTYRMDNLPLWDRGGPAAGFRGLSPQWQSFVRELASRSYRDALLQLTGVDVEGDIFDIACVRYYDGYYVSPHPDKPEKSLGHVLFFNQHWEPDWGGAFAVLEGPSEIDVHERILPLAGTSVVLVRSDNSYHSVERIRGQHARLGMHVNFWRTDPGSVRPGRTYGHTR